jgi:hypothetical protein
MAGPIIKSILIKDTTREQRMEIIRRSLYACGEACDGCSSCDGLTGIGDPWEMYKPYIEGQKEIAEINAEFNARYIK